MPWMAIVGAAVSAAGAVKQGTDARKAGEFNADIADKNAEMSVMNASIAEEQIRRKYGRLKGTQEAIGASSGLAASGSFLEVMADQAYEAEKDALLARWQGATGAANETLQGDLARMQGKNAQTTGYMSAFGTLLQGASNYAQMKEFGTSGATNGVIGDSKYRRRWKEE